MRAAQNTQRESFVAAVCGRWSRHAHTFIARRIFQTQVISNVNRKHWKCHGWRMPPLFRVIPCHTMHVEIVEYARPYLLCAVCSALCGECITFCDRHKNLNNIYKVKMINRAQPQFCIALCRFLALSFLFLIFISSSAACCLLHAHVRRRSHSMNCRCNGTQKNKFHRCEQTKRLNEFDLSTVRNK